MQLEQCQSLDPQVSNPGRNHLNPLHMLLYVKIFSTFQWKTRKKTGENSLWHHSLCLLLLEEECRKYISLTHTDTDSIFT